MSVILTTTCRICNRTSSCNPETELCPLCEFNPEAARKRRAAFLVQVWLLRLAVLGAVVLGFFVLRYFL